MLFWKWEGIVAEEESRKINTLKTTLKDRILSNATKTKNF